MSENLWGATLKFDSPIQVTVDGDKVLVAYNTTEIKLRWP